MDNLLRWHSFWQDSIVYCNHKTTFCQWHNFSWVVIVNYIKCKHYAGCTAVKETSCILKVATGYNLQLWTLLHFNQSKVRWCKLYSNKQTISLWKQCCFRRRVSPYQCPHDWWIGIYEYPFRSIRVFMNECDTTARMWP